MFINDVSKKDGIRKIALQNLRKYGIKFREKQRRQISQVSKSSKFFKIPLQCLENETITLKNGRQLVIPKQLYEVCSFIIGKIETEGIFRKEGSRSRQHEIKLLLDRGCLLDDHHVVDVAVVLKCFLRELPEPLIPYCFHELFLRCSLIEKKTEAVLLACLLLPTEHLNVLSFLMQFFCEVANYSHYNKMNSYNIATVIGPNIFPINEKVNPKNKIMIIKACNIIKIMIENSLHIGEIPEYIIEEMGTWNPSHEDNLDLKLKRRSGSFTRIFHGLKKMVGNKPDMDILNKTATPDLLLTSPFHCPGKSQQEDLAQCELNGNIRKGTGSSKILKQRRWSTLPQAAVKKKRRNSLFDLSRNDTNVILKDSEIENMNDYLKVTKTEYDEIKDRVYKIEKELSRELKNVKVVCDNINLEYDDNITDIQSAYEQTLVHTELLSQSTDHLARRLSKELRIRTSEQKIIRSPSARKIGNLKRRSRELERPSKIFKSASFHEIKHEVADERKQNISPCNSYQLEKIPSKLRPFHSVNSFDVTTNKVKKMWKPTYIDLNTTYTEEDIPTNIVDGNLNSLQSKAILSKRGSTKMLYNLSPRNIFSNSTVQNKNPRSSVGTDAHKEKLVKQNVPPMKRNVNLKQKTKSKENVKHMKQVGRNIKENVNFIEEREKLAKEFKCLNKHPPKIIPYIKKPIIIKSPKRIYSPSLNSVRNTPLKAISSSHYFNSKIFST